MMRMRITRKRRMRTTDDENNDDDDDIKTIKRKQGRGMRMLDEDDEGQR